MSGHFGVGCIKREAGIQWAQSRKTQQPSKMTKLSLCLLLAFVALSLAAPPDHGERHEPGGGGHHSGPGRPRRHYEGGLNGYGGGFGGGGGGFGGPGGHHGGLAAVPLGLSQSSSKSSASASSQSGSGSGGYIG